MPNFVTLTAAGHVGRDASTRQAGNTTVTGFPLAINVKRKGQDETIWLDVSVWGKRGESIQPYVSKGDAILISGRFSTREHEGRTYYQVDANEVEFLGGKRQGGKPSAGNPESPDPAQDSGYHDDIPF